MHRQGKTVQRLSTSMLAAIDTAQVTEDLSDFVQDRPTEVYAGAAAIILLLILLLMVRNRRAKQRAPKGEKLSRKERREQRKAEKRRRAEEKRRAEEQDRRAWEQERKRRREERQERKEERKRRKAARKAGAVETEPAEEEKKEEEKEQPAAEKQPAAEREPTAEKETMLAAALGLADGGAQGEAEKTPEHEEAAVISEWVPPGGRPNRGDEETEAAGEGGPEEALEETPAPDATVETP